MPALEVGQKLVALCKDGKSNEALATLYDEKVVSIEGQGSDEMPARIEGISGVKGKAQWWEDNHEIHSTKVVGPYCGHRDDQFVVQFEMDVTNKPNKQRLTLVEVGLYTVANDKVVQEEFLYLMG